MRTWSFSLVSQMLLASIALGDIAIKIPNTAITADVPAVKAASGIDAYFSDAATGSKVSLSLASGTVKFDYNIAAGTGSYKGAAGVLVPLEPTWSNHDITAADSIYFDVMSDVPGVEINLIVGSDLDSQFVDINAAWQSNADQYGGFQKSPKPVKGVSGGVACPTTTWQTIGMSFESFMISPWYTSSKDYDDAIASATQWRNAVAPGLNIGSKVKNIQFQPLWNWNASGSTMSNGTGNFYLRNIRLVGKGLSLYRLPISPLCGGKTSFKFDQFDCPKSAGSNALGGNWYVFTDTNSVKTTDPATGASSIATLNGKATWAPWSFAGVGLGAVRANLEKNLGGTYHKYAGWVDLASNFGTDETGANLAVPLPSLGLNAIGLNLYLGNAGGILPDSLKWDDANLPYVIFKVGVQGVPDSAAYSIKIPADNGLGNKVCIDLDSLTQPSFYANAQPWSPDNKITQISIEAKIDDQSDAAMHSVGPVTMAINDVNFYGLELQAANPYATGVCPEGIKGLSHSGRSLQASYQNGLTISYTLPGSSAQLDILRLDGSRVARLQVPATATNLHVSQPLARGTYMLALRGESTTQVVPLTVAR